MSTTSEPMTNPDSPQNKRTRPGRRVNRAALVLAVVLGLVMCGAATIGGELRLGLVFLGIMLVTAGGIWVASRYSDTVALLGDDVHDERHVHVHQRSALYTLNILALVIIGGFVYDLAQGGDGNPYALLGAVGGVTYVVCLLVLSRRS